MDAIYYKRGDIRGVVALIRLLASALSRSAPAHQSARGTYHQESAPRWDRRISKAIGLSTKAEDHAALGRQLAQASRQPSTRRSAVSCSRSRSATRKSRTAHSCRSSSRPARPLCSGASSSAPIPQPSPSLRSSFRPPVLSASRRLSHSFASARIMRRRLVGLHPASRVHGRRLSEAAGWDLHHEHHRHDADRPHNGRPHGSLSAIPTSTASALA